MPGKKTILKIVITFVFVSLLLANGISLVSAILMPSVWTYLFVFGVIGVDLYFCYVTFYQKREPRYPMVPPEGKSDIYFPRTNIPRPIHEDFRRMEEKKRKLAKMDKMRHKKKRK